MSRLFAQSHLNGMPSASLTPVTQGTPVAQGTQATVRVEHLSRVIETRSEKKCIVDDLTFTIPAQSLFAINGPSGSGKSTILNLLTGIDRPTSGHILFEGEKLHAKSENAREWLLLAALPWHCPQLVSGQAQGTVPMVYGRGF
jgi:ABC-type transport system involved in cytochrome bd biosynthesis fused ATPase/permease subunit